MPETNTKALTEREKTFISSNKAKVLNFSDRYVLMEYEGKRLQLWEIRERRGQYLQFVVNFTEESAAKRKFSALNG